MFRMLKILAVLVILVLQVQHAVSAGVEWNRLKCSTDSERALPEGIVRDIGRFPWLGVVQHSFTVSGQPQFAITSAVLIHPGYAIASAADISSIDRANLINNTKLVLFPNAKNKHVIDVIDYTLHPEYTDRQILATLALVELHPTGQTGAGEYALTAVLPVCLPIGGAGTFNDLYTVRITDERKKLEKRLYKMDFVENEDCDEFYRRAKLDYARMKPTQGLCATVHYSNKSCVWDEGSVLITRQNWGYFKLLGFGVRGPGCGAPVRFVSVRAMLPWIDRIIGHVPEEDLLSRRAFVMRQLSPYKLTMFKADTLVPTKWGDCERRLRGNVIYKDSMEITVDKNFAQGFFFLELEQVAHFKCVTVELKTSARTNTGLWVEHHCHNDQTAEYARDRRRKDCFMYFKSMVSVEFRFFFSYVALIDISFYGEVERVKFVPDPFRIFQTTDIWIPTELYFRWSNLVPKYKNVWNP